MHPNVVPAPLPQIQMPLTSLFGNLEASKVVSLLFLFLFVVWLVYTLIASYHWLRYGHRSVIAIPALTIHVFVSLALAGFAASGLVAL